MKKQKRILIFVFTKRPKIAFFSRSIKSFPSKSQHHHQRSFSAMNTSQFMDKQIMDLKLSQNNNKDFFDLMNHHPPPQHKKEEMLPNYDFQSISGNLSQSLSFDAAGAGGNTTGRIWNSADNKINVSSSPPIRNYGSMDPFEPTKFIPEKDQNVSDGAIMSEIDRTMKKYVDTLLHVLEGINARVTQMETTTCNLENSVNELKVSVENNHGSTDGKMRQMENILREVQSGIHVLKEKQETVEAQLAKLQVSKIDRQPESESTAPVDIVHQSASAPPQSHLQPPPPPPPHVTFLQSLPPPPAPQQNLQLPPQLPQNQIPSVPQREPYFPPPGQTQDVPNQQYQAPPTQQQHPPPAAPPLQPYQPPQPQYSHPPQPPQFQSSLGHHYEETAYNPSQNYPPSLCQPVSEPSSGPPSSQTNYRAPPSDMYEPSLTKSSSRFPTGYGSPSVPSEPYPYGGLPSQYGSGSTMKPHQLSSAMAQSGGSSYTQLSTERVLPHALPAASGTGNRVPIDDVVDKVTSMGFHRDHVRATVRKLTENGQAVDLNIVLDKLMNDGEVQPQRGWFGQ